MASYDEEFKKRIVRMHVEEGRTIRSLSQEYHVSENGIGYWLKKYREECSKDPAAKEEYDLMKENLKLRKEIEEMRKENEFLKKAAAFFAKEIDQQHIDLSTKTKARWA